MPRAESAAGARHGFGMVPMASASSAYNVKLTETTPDASKLSTAIQQNKFKLQNGEEAYADNDTVRAIVILRATQLCLRH